MSRKTTHPPWRVLTMLAGVVAVGLLARPAAALSQEDSPATLTVSG